VTPRPTTTVFVDPDSDLAIPERPAIPSRDWGFSRTGCRRTTGVPPALGHESDARTAQKGAVEPDSA